MNKPTTGEREAFEAWAAPLRYDVGHKGPMGEYLGGATSIAWEAWQARAACFAGGSPARDVEAPAAIKEGWKLVPIEPTREMLRAVDDMCDGDKYLARGRACDVWDRMISAIDRLAAAPIGSDK